MSNINEIYEWLELAFTEYVDRLNELFFFDRRDNEFYSVFITDYLLEDRGDIEKIYSPAQWELILERITRNENNDPGILLIPRLTVAERKELLQAFIDQFHLPELEGYVNNENGRTRLDFGGSLSSPNQMRWQAFKWDFIQDKIDSFCKLNNIDLGSAMLFNTNKLTTVSIKIDPLPKKPWWRFW